MLEHARGFAIFTVLKAGFVWSGKAGSGVVIARLDDGTWSAPSCIATGGVGFGLQIGADLSEVRVAVGWLLRAEADLGLLGPFPLPPQSLRCLQVVIVLNSNEAVAAFAKGGNVTIGGSLAAAAGPIGVGGAVNTPISAKPAPMFTYSKSKGLFAGVSLEGTVLIERVGFANFGDGSLDELTSSYDLQKDANEAFYGQAIPAVDLLRYDI